MQLKKIKMKNKRNKIFTIITFCGLTALYLLFVGQFSKAELTFGCIFSLFIILLITFVKSIEGISFKFDKKMIKPFIYVPFAVIRETILLFAAEFKKLFGKHITGKLIAYPYELKNEETDLSKFALIIFGINISPNSYVCFYKDGKVYLRQLVGNKLSKGDEVDTCGLNNPGLRPL
jgi:multisubunit Na+/H+ antiporter MnhE subunit